MLITDSQTPYTCFLKHKRLAFVAGGNGPNWKENSEILSPQRCFDVNLR